MKTLSRLTIPLFCLLYAVCCVPSNAFAMARKPPKGLFSTDTLPEITRTYSLRDCYFLTLKRSESLAMKKESIEEAKAGFLKASGELIGDADFVITNSRQEDIGLSNSSAGGGLGASFFDPVRRERVFTFQQPVFQGFRTMAAFIAAGGYTKQRKFEWMRARQLLFQDVSSAFYDVLFLKKDIAILKETLKHVDDRVKELRHREQVGRSRTAEVVMTEAKYKTYRAELARSERALLLAQHTLEFLTGIPIPADKLEDAQTKENEIIDLETYLPMAMNRYDVEAVWQAEKVARGGVIDAQSGLWPQVSLQANRYVKRTGTQGNIDWDALLTFDVPLGRGGDTLGKIKESVSVWKKTKLNYELVRRQAELEIKTTYDDLLASREEYEAYKAAFDISMKNYELEKTDYSMSLVSNLDVLTALETAKQNARQSNTTFYQTKKKYWNFQIALGNCCDSI